MCLLCRAQARSRETSLPLCMMVYGRQAMLHHSHSTGPPQQCQADLWLSPDYRTMKPRATLGDKRPNQQQFFTLPRSVYAEDDESDDVRPLKAPRLERDDRPRHYRQPVITQDFSVRHALLSTPRVMTPAVKRWKEQSLHEPSVYSTHPESEDTRADLETDSGGCGGSGNGSGSGGGTVGNGSSKSSSSFNDVLGQEGSIRLSDKPKLSSDSAGPSDSAAQVAVDQFQACQCGAGSASLWLPGKHEGPPKYCPKCRKKAVSVATLPLPHLSNRKCVCGRSQPSFGVPGPEGRVPKWCAQCPAKPANAIDVVSKRCLCGRSKPSLGLNGEERRAARWCAQCPTKAAEAVDIVNKRCECRASLPSLGLPGEERRFARWCARCPSKPDNAVNVINKRCECRANRPRYGLTGDKPKDARWCSLCPTRPTTAVDVIKQKRSSARPEPVATRA
uniref:Uncharacterized protein n=1 Tax=Tetraselmis chuii TaxID=63592 RepID=A0A7S1SYV5_9CHLO|mmetsp:Transcript_36649/g.65598  ORF Transcript_36649/g.65598 Transcript_36649/m.65598 type:complete len:447 (+) Transcript_36649:159-1499(+)